MKTAFLMTAFGLAALTSTAGFAQGAGYAPPQPSAIHPDSNAVTANNREQVESYNHVANNLEARNAASASKGSASKATAADLTVGAAVRDINGQTIGKIDSVDSDGVVIDTGQSKAKLPLNSFGKDKSGLLIGITAAKFNQVVAAAHAQASASASAPPAAAGPRPAAAADISAGASLRDVNGQPIGKIAGVAADGAILDTGHMKIKLPLDAFGVDGSGLVLGITSQKLNEIIAQAEGSAGKKK
jgi:hypothetical protein